MPDKTCFVIAPIGEEQSEVRKRSDQVLKYIIGPAAAECGYVALRADRIAEPGLITTQVIQHIVEDPLVVADLSGTNPNVFYELAVRHAIRKPLVQIIQKGEKIPFDVAGMRTVPVDHRDLDSVAEAKTDIVKQIKAVETRSPAEIESPISVSVELQSLRESSRPEDRTMAEFVATLVQMRSDVLSIQDRLSSPEKIIPPQYLREIVLMSSQMLDRRGTLIYHEVRLMLDELRSIAAAGSPESRPNRELISRIDRMAERLSMEREALR